MIVQGQIMEVQQLYRIDCSIQHNTTTTTQYTKQSKPDQQMPTNSIKKKTKQRQTIGLSDIVIGIKPQEES